MDISIILPFYNEEKNAKKVIDDVFDFFCKQSRSFEIIAINDGSLDNTQEILNEYKRKGIISVISHIKNTGYGAALKSGFEKAKGDLIFFTDSDCQFDIKDIAVFLDKIKNYDFVVGYRKNRKDSLIRRINAKIFGFSAKIFFRIKVKDIDCAFKLFKKHVLSGKKLLSNGLLLNLEIFILAKKDGYKFLELPVNHFKRKMGKQTGGRVKIILRAAVDFLYLWHKYKNLPNV